MRAGLRAWARRSRSTDLDLKSYAEFEAEAKAMTADSTVDEINAGGGEAIGYRDGCAGSRRGRCDGGESDGHLGSRRHPGY